jgi:hypothetical protein
MKLNILYVYLIGYALVVYTISLIIEVISKGNV